jgi:NAD+ synthase (glutamine-hydrolysing)
VLGTYCKRELPNYQVFDERRYFVSGRDAGLAPLVFEAGGLRFGLLICEDAWFDEPAQAARGAGAQVLCVLNASPFHLDKAGEREARMAERRARHRPAAAVCPPGGRAGRGGVRRRLVCGRRPAQWARAPAFEPRTC